MTTVPTIIEQMNKENPFFKLIYEDPPCDVSIEADDLGSVHIRLTSGYTLDITSTDPTFVPFTLIFHI